MQSSHRFLSVLPLALLSASAMATTTSYTSEAAFLAQVASGAYFENFDGLTSIPLGPVSFSGNGFSYSAFAPKDLFASGDFFSTNQPYETLTITFTSGNVTAVGGNFFATDLSNAFQAGEITLTLSDNTTVALTPASPSSSYRGFTSTAAITSLSITLTPVQFNQWYASVDNLTVGASVTAVPEPGTWLLMGLGLAGLAVARRRSV